MGSSDRSRSGPKLTASQASRIEPLTSSTSLPLVEDVRGSGRPGCRVRRITAAQRSARVPAVATLVATLVAVRFGSNRYGPGCDHMIRQKGPLTSRPPDHGPLAADESGCTPGSVPTGPRGPVGDGHPSRAGVATGLQRSTRGLGRAALDRPRRGTGVPPLDLAPGGVYLAAQVALGTGGLLHHRFTLTGGRSLRRSVFCGTVPRVTPGGR